MTGREITPSLQHHQLVLRAFSASAADDHQGLEKIVNEVIGAGMEASFAVLRGAIELAYMVTNWSTSSAPARAADPVFSGTSSYRW
jgi:hypothetical protein